MNDIIKMITEHGFAVTFLAVFVVLFTGLLKWTQKLVEMQSSEREKWRESNEKSQDRANEAIDNNTRATKGLGHSIEHLSRSFEQFNRNQNHK